MFLIIILSRKYQYSTLFLLWWTQTLCHLSVCRGKNSLHILGHYGKENAAAIFELFMECMPDYPINKPDDNGNTGRQNDCKYKGTYIWVNTYTTCWWILSRLLNLLAFVSIVSDKNVRSCIIHSPETKHSMGHESPH